MHSSSSLSSKSSSYSQKSQRQSPFCQVMNIPSQNIIIEDENVQMNGSFYDVHNSSSMIVNVGSQPSDFEPPDGGFNGAMPIQPEVVQSQYSMRSPPQSPQTLEEASSMMMERYVEGQSARFWINTDKATPPRGQIMVAQQPQLPPQQSQNPMQGWRTQIDNNQQVSQNPSTSSGSSDKRTTIIDSQGYFTPGFSNTSSKSSQQSKRSSASILSQGHQVNSSQSSLFSFGQPDSSQSSLFSFGKSSKSSFIASSQQML